MATSDFVTMQQKRGLKANLPASAPEGQLLITTDTSELFYGTGTGVEQIGAGNEHQTRYSIYDDIQAVYADGMPGGLDPKGREGWYFSNPTLGQKINWYYYNPALFSTTVANLQNAYAIVTLDTAKYPFFGVYTEPTGSGDAQFWYKSRRVYSATTTTVTAGNKYLIHFGTDPGVYPELPRITLTLNNSLSDGAFAPTETVYLLALNTNSAQPANDYSFVAHQLGFQTTATKQAFNLKIKSNNIRTFTQSTPATTWTIVHNMGTYPKITTVDNGGALIEGNVTYASSNVIRVEFSPAVAGKAYFI